MDDKTNNDLILREKLAIERTRLANDRTLLSFIRTSLYFGIAGISVNSIIVLTYGWVLEMGFIIFSMFLIVIGIIRYRRVREKINDSKKYVGMNLELDDE